MKTCPVCKIDLKRRLYEGFQIWQCGKCHGHLMPEFRLESLKRVKTLTSDELKKDAQENFKYPAEHVIRCPNCHMNMEKRSMHSKVTLFVDICQNCKTFWFDPGELALVQLAYEAETPSIESEELKKRLNDLELSPERKAMFEKNLSKMRKGGASEAIMDGFEEALSTALGLILRQRLRL